MKKLLTLLLAISTFSFINCDRDDDIVNPTKTVKPAKTITITSFYPETARIGAELAIFGENFGPTVSENYVTFNGMDAEVLNVPYDGMILVKIPSLAPGDYTVRVHANGQSGTCPKALKILGDINF